MEPRQPVYRAPPRQAVWEPPIQRNLNTDPEGRYVLLLPLLLGMNKHFCTPGTWIKRKHVIFILIFLYLNRKGQVSLEGSKPGGKKENSTAHLVLIQVTNWMTVKHAGSLYEDIFKYTYYSAIMIFPLKCTLYRQDVHSSMGLVKVTQSWTQHLPTLDSCWEALITLACNVKGALKSLMKILFLF